MISGGDEDRVAGPRHRLRRRHDHLQRHRGAVAARRRAAPRRGRVQRRGHRRPRWPRCDPRHAEPGAADLHHQPRRPGVLRRRSWRSPPSPRSCSTACSSRVQTVRHRDYFLPITTAGEVVDDEEHADPPTTRAALTSLGLLAGRAGRGGRADAKVRVARDRGRRRRRRLAARRSSVSSSRCSCCCPRRSPRPAPPAATASRPASTSPSARPWPASGSTIPAIAVASIWLDGPLLLGLGADPDGAARPHRRGRHR